MANRRFVQFGSTLEPKVVKLFAKIKYVSGSATLITSEVLNSTTSPITVDPSLGFESLTATSGSFTLFLGANNGGVPTFDTYTRLLNVTAVGVIDPAGPNPPLTVLSSVAVQDDNVNGAAGNPSLTLLTLVVDPTGGQPSVGDPEDGTVVLLEVTLSNTTAY